MSEFQAAQGFAAAVTASVAKPRVSADAFRMLTARLKKVDAAAVAPAATAAPVIPDFTPAFAPPAPAVHHAEPAMPASPPAPVGAVAAAAPQPFEVPTTPVDVVAAAEPLVAEVPTAGFVHETHVVPLQPVSFSDTFESAVEPEIAPPTSLDLRSAFEELTSTAEGELPEPEAIALSDFDIAPVEAEVATPVAAHEAESLDDVWSQLLPEAPEPQPEIASAMFGNVPEQESHAWPDADVTEESAVTQEHAAVPDAEIAAPVQDIEDPVADQEAVETSLADNSGEPQLEGSFGDNFTYVPVSGEEAEVADAAAGDADNRLKKNMAERAVELELENIWRLMLAKPTADDRATYLKEAAIYNVVEEKLEKPPEEFDLSRIQPAEFVEQDLELPAPEAPSVEVAVPPALNIAIPEGQDLGDLTRSLLDMMAAGNASGLPHERALAADTLLRLVPRLDLKSLMLLSSRIAMMDSPPTLLVARLIRDPRVEVAGPLLEDCSSITDKDLESVVHEGEPAKLRMIARRRHLTRSISDALIKSGDPSAVLTLVRNKDAEISHGGFESLLVLCENNEELLAPLATRQDLAAPVAFELFWRAPAQLRRFILSRFLTDSENLTKILKITMAANQEDGESEPLSQHGLLEALERACRGQTEIAADELAGIMQLNAATVARILGDFAGEPLVVMLKAAAYPRTAMTGLLKRMQDAELPIISRERDVSELQNLFETLSFNKARILLTYWDWAQSKTGPYAPVH